MSKLLFYDLETTGVMHWKNGIHQISGMIVIDGEIKETFNYKVQPNPKAIIEVDALKVGNVTLEQVQAYEPMRNVFNEIQAMLCKYVDKFSKTDKMHLVGYNNASFDNQFFRAFFVQNAITEKDAAYGNYFGSWFWSDTIDVMVLASNKLRSERAKLVDFKLKTVAKYLGIEVNESKLHDALYDIELTKAIYDRI